MGFTQQHCRAMEGPRAGIHNVEQHVNQLEQRLEDCLTHKADAAEVPTNYQVPFPSHPPHQFLVIRSLSPITYVTVILDMI